MLRLLGTSISYSRMMGRKCIPFTETHHGFEIPFYEIFLPIDDSLVEADQYDAAVKLYSENPCDGAPGNLAEIKLRYVGSASLGNLYEIQSTNEPFPYDLELDETMEKDEMFQLTTGQRMPMDQRILEISGGWPSSISAIRVNDDILLESLERRNSIGTPYIGIHFRNTDMKHDIGEAMERLTNSVSETNFSEVFFATDDIGSLEIFKDNFPNLNFHTFSDIPDYQLLAQKSLHYMSHKALQRAGLTRKRQIEETLIDIFCLCGSSDFIGSDNSAMTKLVRFLREEKDLFQSFAPLFFKDLESD